MSTSIGPRTLPTQVARGGSKPGAVLPIAAAAALALACVPTSVLFADRQWVWPALVTIAAVCGAGGLLRALPVPLLIVPLTQSAVFGAAMAWLFGAQSDGEGTNPGKRGVASSADPIPGDVRATAVASVAVAIRRGDNRLGAIRRL